MLDANGSDLGKKGKTDSQFTSQTTDFTPSTSRLLEVIKELQQTNEELEKRIKYLENN